MKISARGSRVVALLVASLMAIGVVGITATAGASNEASIAKKCKKGYKKKTVKKNGKKTTKCVKKKKKAAKTSDLVESVTLNKYDFGVYNTKLFYTVKLKRATTTLKVKAMAKRGDKTTTSESTVTVPGDVLEHSLVSKANSYSLAINRQLKGKPYSFWVEIDGVKSNVLP